AVARAVVAADPQLTQPALKRLRVSRPAAFATSPPVWMLATARAAEMREEGGHPVLPLPHRYPLRPLFLRDTALQASMLSPRLAPTPGVAFDGIGMTTGFFVPVAPPDTNGAVGRSQYVQWVNTSFAVYRKSDGRKLSGPTAGNKLFAKLGGICATSNDGDPIAIYDKLANRWILTQFALPNLPFGPFLQCIAVSRTSDATGSYHLYAYSFDAANDYPKLGVWPD